MVQTSQVKHLSAQIVFSFYIVRFYDPPSQMPSECLEKQLRLIYHYLSFDRIHRTFVLVPSKLNFSDEIQTDV